jgi:endonuclease YncB( thermonuclease family)
MTRPNRLRLTLIAAIALPLSATVAAETVSADNLVDKLSAEFKLCQDRRRANCVIDGDTFWFRRQKIRIADIDAPELSPPRCAEERKRGAAAKLRLLELLNGGPFSLTIDARDQDRYGRKLRIVTRRGQSFGDVLVDEGLARRWSGTRRPWCG